MEIVPLKTSADLLLSDYILQMGHFPIKMILSENFGKDQDLPTSLAMGAQNNGGTIRLTVRNSSKDQTPMTCGVFATKTGYRYVS
jgi:hypothetical protein